MNYANVPGVVINHIPAATESYIGSPSIAKLADGTYLASHDIFGPGSEYSKSMVYASSDRGETWERICEVSGAFWCSLFAHRDAVYLMGADGRFGNLIIRRSDDAGRHWTDPVDGKSGLLRSDGGYHTAPMPVVEHKGRLWRAFEDLRPGRKWGEHFRAFVMSAPVEADLLDENSWTFTNALAGDMSWLEGKFGGWLEGNAVVSPQGTIVDVLRADYRVGGEEKAAITTVSEDGTTNSFSTDDFVAFPGGCKKFTIRRDPETGGYWTLANYVPEKFISYNAERARNTLALMYSDDLRSWKVRSVVLSHDDTEKHAFQYVDWIFEDNDIIVASRTAYDDGEGGAHNQHDANFMTFHRISEFRSK